MCGRDMMLLDELPHVFSPKKEGVLYNEYLPTTSQSI